VKSLLTAIITGILLMYPFAVYFGLKYFSPTNLAFFLLAALLVRIVLLRRQLEKMPWLLPATLLGMFAIALSSFTETSMGFKLYPLGVNFAMLMVFGYSYFKPPTVIESLARLTEKDFPEQAVVYTQKVTLVWCLFFIANGLVSLYTALFLSFDTWLLYNGFLSYIFMGLLMGVEYLVRIKVKKTHQQNVDIKDTHNHIKDNNGINASGTSTNE
jgi:uncharacterized membrane protein